MNRSPNSNGIVTGGLGAHVPLTVTILIGDPRPTLDQLLSCGFHRARRYT